MSYRQSLHPSTTSSSQTHLQTRIAQKRHELANLQELRNLSADLASQMALLEQKLSTLKDGTEAVACVLENWNGVLRAIGMAGAGAAKVASDKVQEGEEKKLPETLVRIPIATERGGEAQDTG